MYKKYANSTGTLLLTNFRFTNFRKYEQNYNLSMPGAVRVARMKRMWNNLILKKIVFAFSIYANTFCVGFFLNLTRLFCCIFLFFIFLKNLNLLAISYFYIYFL